MKLILFQIQSGESVPIDNVSTGIVELIANAEVLIKMSAGFGKKYHLLILIEI